MINIAVLIACHNRKSKTIKCLSNLYQQKGNKTEYNFSVFLVDDGSTDGTDIAVRQNFPNVNIITGTGNLYWNRGMHLAWDEAAKQNFDAYLWLNDDTFLYENALEILVNHLLETDSKSIICGTIESPDHKGRISYGGGKHIDKKFKMNIPRGDMEECDIINGNCVLIPRYVFEKVGNLDRNFIHCMGDNDYSLRAKKLGIVSYTTGNFVGSCSDKDSLPQWCLPEIPIKKRLKNLYSPLGNSHPYYYFRFEYRHYGFLTAFKHFFTIHLRVTFPRLWI